MPPSIPFPLLVVACAALVAAVTDVWKYKVHNLLTVPLLVTGLLYHAWTQGWPGFFHSTAAAGLGFSVFFTLYLVGGMGAGDVKLVAALGAWLGAWLMMLVCLYAACAGGVYALGVILWRGQLGQTWVNFRVIWHRLAAVTRHFSAEDGVELEVGRPDRRQRLVPYAAMFAIGLFALMLIAWHNGVLHQLTGW